MKNFYTTIILLICFSSLNAQIGFGNHVIINDSDIIEEPSRAIPADIDGDGDNDVVAASGGGIYWYQNSNGLGSFLFPKIVTTAVSDAGIYTANSVAVGDIDNDGDIDIVSATYNKIAWYENLDGSGNFGAQQIIYSNGGIWRFSKMGDIDGDGDLDILASSGDTNNGGVRWFENTDGMGNYVLKQIVTTDGGSDIALADIDGDGDADILLGGFEFSNQKRLVKFENTDGLGTFGPRQFIGNGSSSGAYIAVGDIDNDGDLDIAYTKYSSDYVLVATNTDGLGNFTSQVIDVIDNPRTIAIGDLNGDGDLDISVVASGGMVLYDNTDGQGDYNLVDSINISSSDLNIIQLFDMDNDADLDVMYYSRNRNNIAWRENNDGLGSFSEQQIISSNIHETNDTFTADLDGDGDKDFLATYDNGVAWFENEDGQGQVVKQQIISSRLSSACSVFATDIDNDGDNDVLSASPFGIAIHENTNGQGLFAIEEEIGSTNGGRVVYATDMDMDGDMDIVYAADTDTNGNSKIAWVENLTGDGNFGTEQVISTEVMRPTSIYMADLDGDGDNDLISASYLDNKIAWYENTNGNGVFGTQQVLADVLGEGYDVYAADMDNDNDLDIIATSGSSVSWFENTNGLGNFNLQQTYSDINNTNGFTSVLVTDVDNDGDNDIVVGTDFQFRIFWLRNTNGLGLMGNEQLISDDFDSKIYIHADDINGDNKVDIIAASGYNFISSPNSTFTYNQLVWLGNEGIVKNEINGYINYDESANACTTDSEPVNNILIQTTNGTETISTISLTNGFFSLFPEDGNFSTTVISELPDYYTVNPESIDSNFSGIGNVDSVNFCVEPNQVINDLNISVIPVTPEARPGFNTIYRIVYSNAGTVDLDGTVTLGYDNAKLNFLNASETANSQTANTLGFDFSNLVPFETRSIDLEFNIFSPPTVNLGDILSFTANIDPFIGDYTEEDNVFSFNQAIIGSFDPNDITVLEGDEIFVEEKGDYLHYVIRFQNTGTASAIQVKVDNTLDTKLNWNTFQLLSTSHNVEVEIRNGNEVSYTFNGIYLPDSTSDEENSHGFISYKIKPRANVELGDVFTSVADIYFDFNPAIVTNIVNTEIVEPLSINDFENPSYLIYPNPTKDFITITSHSNLNIVNIRDINGRLIKTFSSETQDFQNQLDVSALTSGLYFLELKSGVNRKTLKFIKK